MRASRLRALVWRECVEILRDPFQLTAAFVVPTVLMLVLGFGLSIDVKGLRYAALDHDRTPESRAYLDVFHQTREFAYEGMLGSDAERERAMEEGRLRFVIEIAPGFGRSLATGRPTEVAFWIDGTRPFHAETAQGYVEAAHRSFLSEHGRGQGAADPPARLETRFWYNQGLESRLAIVPGLVAVLLAILPPVLTAVAVAREREVGSIANLYATPMTRLEFLLGKQIPHVAVGLADFAILSLLVVLVFQVPCRGSVLTLVAGAAVYLFATTALGLLLSCASRTQISALLMTLIVTMLPAFLYSGLFTPTSSLSAGARLLAASFPATYFVEIVVGTFTKGLGFGELWPNFVWLALFAGVLGAASAWLFPAQER